VSKSTDIRDSKVIIDEKTAFHNVSAFLARLTNFAVDPGDPRDPLNYSSFGLCALLETFEETETHGDDDYAAIRSASMWIQYSGDSLKELALREQDKMEARAGIPKELRDKLWKGLVQEKWEVWKAGFEEVEDSVAEAKIAAQIMREL